jgi:AhpD family alkylhydroperoxidase
MAVVPLLDGSQAPLLAQPYFANGDPGPIVSSLAHVPELLEVAMPFLGIVFGPSSVSLRTKEIVVLRTSVLQSCRYCTETHTVVARDAGLSLDEVRELRGEGAAGGIEDPADVALVRWIDAVAGTTQVPPPDVVASLQEHHSEPAIVELTALIGATMMLNRYATSLRLPTSHETLHRLGEEGLARTAAG